MSTPPVDPWSTQPEPGSFPPPHQPPPPGDWPPGSHPGAQPPAQAWPQVPQQGGHHEPTQAYGYPPAPQPTSPYPAYQPGQAGVQPPGSPAGYPGAQPAGYPAVPPDGFAGAPAYGPPPAPPPQRSRMGLILSLTLVGLLVLCFGGGGLAYVALSGDDKKPTPTPSPSVVPTASDEPEPTPSESEEEVEPAPEIRLVTPRTLNGRAKNTEPQLRRIADEMVRDMKNDVTNETSAVGAFYGSAAKRNMVMISGVSGPVLLPEKELDDAIKSLSTSLSVRKVASINPGPLGGVAKCGDGKSSGIALGVCVWADEGSVGMIVMFFSSASKAKAEFATIRGQVEKRS
ncbi:hypothetical protein [Micromonospora coxensis]|uniref:hypothetical protein n=1 Tax=Micromonospora coxensis TaxID=356852 RepID=UPI00343A7F38